MFTPLERAEAAAAAATAASHGPAGAPSRSAARTREGGKEPLGARTRAHTHQRTNTAGSCSRVPPTDRPTARPPQQQQQTTLPSRAPRTRSFRSSLRRQEVAGGQRAPSFPPILQRQLVRREASQARKIAGCEGLLCAGGSRSRSRTTEKVPNAEGLPSLPVPSSRFVEGGTGGGLLAPFPIQVRTRRCRSEPRNRRRRFPFFFHRVA